MLAPNRPQSRPTPRPSCFRPAGTKNAFTGDPGPGKLNMTSYCDMEWTSPGTIPRAPELSRRYLGDIHVTQELARLAGSLGGQADKKGFLRAEEARVIVIHETQPQPTGMSSEGEYQAAHNRNKA